MLAFWVGRSLLDDVTLRRLFRLIAALSVLSATYGLVQQFVGFPSWDERWITSSGYVALNVGNGVTRAFVTSLRPGIRCLSQRWPCVLGVEPSDVCRVLLPLPLAAIGIVGSALVLSSVRTSIVAAAALGSMAAARMRLRPGTALLAGALAVVALGIGFSHVPVSAQTTTSAANPTGTLLQHDISGITNPTGSGSTLQATCPRTSTTSSQPSRSRPVTVPALSHWRLGVWVDLRTPVLRVISATRALPSDSSVYFFTSS